MQGEQWMGYGFVVFLVVLFGWAAWSIKRQNRRNDADYKEWLTEKSKVAEKVKGKRFLIIVRGADGRKNNFESALIDCLIDLGAFITAAPTDLASKVWSGDVGTLPQGFKADYVLIGTTWETQEEKSRKNIDFRILDQTRQEIVGAKSAAAATGVLLVVNSLYLIAEVVGRNTAATVEASEPLVHGHV